jgi:hypothetical protein
MIVWKLATRPVTAMSARSDVAVPSPKIVFSPSFRGSPDSESASEPGAIPAFRKRTRKPVTIRVRRP